MSKAPGFRPVFRPIALALLCALLAACETTRPKPPPAPVFVIVLDTLRFDHLVTYVPGFPLGAAFDSLAHDGVVFERAYSSSSWTRTAIATLLTGMDPMTHAVLGRSDVLRSDIPRFPQMLRDAGWKTSAWSPNPNILPLWGFDGGFDSFRDLGALDWAKHKADAAEVFPPVLAALDSEHGAVAFHYIHLMDPHAPYLPPAEDLAAIRANAAFAATFPGVTENSESRESHLRYLAEIRDMDRELGKFLAALRERGLYDKSLILVFADHGEEFLDHGQLFHGKTLYEEVMRIPAVMKLPGNQLAGTRLQEEVGLVDLAPTMLSVLGVNGLANADGRSLWDSAKGTMHESGNPQHAILRLDTFDIAALVDGRDKLLVDRQLGPKLFDLRADPHERRDLLPSSRDRGGALQGILDARIAQRSAGWHIRACGTLKRIELRFLIDTTTTPRSGDFEEGDTLLPVGGDRQHEWTAVLDLEPRIAKQEVFGKLIQQGVGDEDEIILPGTGGTSTLRTMGTIPALYSFGNQTQRRLAASIPLPADGGSARLHASNSARCWPVGQPAAKAKGEVPLDRRPYFRLWYIEPAEGLADSAVDPSLQERLKSLGYNW